MDATKNDQIGNSNMKILGGESVTWWLDQFQFFLACASSSPCRNFSNFFEKTTISVISVQILVWMSMRPFLYGKIYLYIPKDGSDILQIFQQEVGLNQRRKSVNIRAILRYTAKIPT